MIQIFVNNVIFIIIMTRELINDYLKVFLLCLEVEYQRHNNRRLLGAESKLSEFMEKDFDKFIKPKNVEDLELADIVSIFLSVLLTPSNFGDKLTDVLKIHELAMKTQKEASKIYLSSIKKATIEFGKNNNLFINSNFKG